MPEIGATARATAGTLMDIEAILFRPEDPFIFTSGRASPVYVDCRKIISFPEARNRLMALAVETIETGIGAGAIDVVAGGETAGIPFAAWIAERLDKPMIYVRKKPKGFGRDAQIEGTFDAGARVLLVEDLATDGGSKLNFVEAIRSAGGRVADTFVIFHYGIFPEGIAALAEHGVKLHALATWWDALALAEERGYLSGAGLSEVRAFLEDPESWSAAHGGKTGGKTGAETAAGG
ncbi:MAG: orotate phosphoribosyltransferase [Proteobacteria bacterium]|nr:orotate phosphoribosyltransferase [Pseudomonadota bacterium]